MDNNNMYQNQTEGGNQEPTPQPDYNAGPEPQSVYGADSNNNYSGNNYSAYGGSSYNAYGSNGYNAGNGYAYSQTAYPVDMEEPVSVGEWIITMLIMMVPCVNLIMMFVFAFGSSSKKSKSNYFKAALIMTGIIFAVYLILVIVFAAVGFASIY